MADRRAVSARLRRQRWRLVARNSRFASTLEGSGGLDDHDEALAFVRGFTDHAVAQRAGANHRSSRYTAPLRRSLRVAMPTAFSSVGPLIHGAIRSVDGDRAAFADVSRSLVTSLRDLEPARAAATEWLRLRYVLAAHGFVEASAIARKHARTAATSIAQRSDDDPSMLTLATALQLDAGEVHSASELLHRRTNRFPTQVDQLPAFVAIANDDWEAVKRIARAIMRADADHKMADIVRDRTVAVVGPAPSSHNHGAEIDAHDVVVRMQYTGPASRGAPAIAGTRTDIAYYRKPHRVAGTLGTIDGAVILPAEIKCAVTEHAAGKYTARPIRRGIAPAAPGIFGLRPTTYQKIQFAVYDLLHFQPAHVTIFNTTFYLSPKLYHAGFESRGVVKNTPVDLSTQFARLDPIGNRNFVRHVLAGERVTLDADGQRVATMSDVEYARGLDAYFGAGAWPRQAR